MANLVELVVQAKDQYSREIGKARRDLDAMAATARRAGLALTAVGAAGAAAFALLVKSSLEQQVGIRKLDQALQLLGLSYANRRDEIEKVIEAQQRLTNFGDEIQRQSLQKLIALSGDYANSLKALPIVLDLASALSIDLAAASNLVGRGLGGNTELFSRYGIEIDSNATATELLTKLTEQFGGAAAAAADPVTQMKNRLGDVGQLIGDVLLPVVEDAATLIERMAREVQDLNPDLVKYGTFAAAAATGVALLAGTTLFLAGAVIPAATRGIVLLQRALTGLRAAITLTQVAMFGLIALVVGGAATFSTFFATFDAAFRSGKSASEAFQIAIAATGEAIGDFLSLEFLLAGATSDLTEEADKLAREVETLTLRFGDGAAAMETLDEKTISLGKAVEGLTAVELDEWMAEAAGRVDELSAAFVTLETKIDLAEQRAVGGFLPESLLSEVEIARIIKAAEEAQKAAAAQASLALQKQIAFAAIAAADQFEAAVASALDLGGRRGIELLLEMATTAGAEFERLMQLAALAETKEAFEELLRLAKLQKSAQEELLGLADQLADAAKREADELARARRERELMVLEAEALRAAQQPAARRGPTALELFGQSLMETAAEDPEAALRALRLFQARAGISGVVGGGDRPEEPGLVGFGGGPNVQVFVGGQEVDAVVATTAVEDEQTRAS